MRQHAPLAGSHAAPEPHLQAALVIRVPTRPQDAIRCRQPGVENLGGPTGWTPAPHRHPTLLQLRAAAGPPGPAHISEARSTGCPPPPQAGSARSRKGHHKPTSGHRTSPRAVQLRQLVKRAGRMNGPWCGEAVPRSPAAAKPRPLPSLSVPSTPCHASPPGPATLPLPSAALPCSFLGAGPAARPADPRQQTLGPTVRSAAGSRSPSGDGRASLPLQAGARRTTP